MNTLSVSVVLIIDMSTELEPNLICKKMEVLGEGEAGT
jgi:hypothetical protein